MLIIFFLSIALLVGIFLLKTFEFSNSNFETVGFLIALSSGVLLFLAVISIPINQLEIKGQIQAFGAIAATAENGRSQPTIESTAFQLKIVEGNQWLAKVQYYNRHWFDLWIPDEVMSLEPIR